MATPAIIWLKVNPEDFGKTLKCDLKEIPNDLDEFIYPCVEVKIHPSPHEKTLWAGIYCHFDGYLDGVGSELVEKFDTYEKVLNLILLGDVCYLINTIKSYQNWRNEGCRIRFKQGEDRPLHTAFHNVYYFENDKWYRNNLIISKK